MTEGGLGIADPRSCIKETKDTVRAGLIGAFERQGMPERILCDDGIPMP